MKHTFTSFSLGAVAALCLAAGPSAFAQKVTGVKATPLQLKPGEAAQIVVDLDVTDDRVNCGMRVYFGDGQQQDIKINQKEDVPIRVQHAYAKAGSYQVKAAPQNIGPIFKCLGKDVSTTLTVTAPAAAAAAAPVAAAPIQNPMPKTAGTVAPPPGKFMPDTKPVCPDGFKLDSKSWNKKSGAFTCTAPKGTAMPAERLACERDLAYFESKKTMRVGCKVE